MAKAVFRVQVVDRGTAEERWLEVPATSRDDAAKTLTALGEIVGKVELLRVIEDAPAPHSAAPLYAQQHHQALPASIGSNLPGAVLCPKCSRCRWKSGFPVISIVLAVLLFPLGLLALLMPRVHRCLACGYSYTGGTDPPTEEPQPTSSWLNILIGLIVAGVIITFLAAIVQAVKQAP